MLTIQKLVEFYEMVSLNDSGLQDSEKAAIRKARRGLRMFQRAMDSLKSSSSEAPAPETSFRVAA